MGGHQVHLLEGGRELFPAMVAAIDAAQQRVWLETYILQAAGQPQVLVDALARAARRGLEVRVLVDGVGTGWLSPSVAATWSAAGVEWEVFAPLGRLGLLVPSRWRRLHRKLCVVDETWVFCGGINVLDDGLDVGGEVLEAPRLDYAVRIQGPLLSDVVESMRRAWWRSAATQRLRDSAWAAALQAVRDGQSKAQRKVKPQTAAPQSPVLATFVERDNLSHRTQIERAYLRAIRHAQREVILAHAYFVPGRRLRRALRQAVQRGVRVRVVLQSRYENFMQFHAARPVHHELLRHGVALYAYLPSALHAKVAVVDGAWATVGSSNLDPLSLLLAREANVVVHDADFARQLQQRLEGVLASDCEPLDAQRLAQRPWAERWRDGLAYLLMRMALWLTGRRY